MHGRIVKTATGVVGWLCAYAPAAPTYFISAEPDFAQVYDDSVVVPLTGPDHIEHARDLILTAPTAGASVFFSEISASGNGTHRDVRDPGTPAWSWHVSRVRGFGDVGTELIGSWPSYVEKNRVRWFDDPGVTPETGKIGFWSYTVVSELPNDPAQVPPATIIPLPAALSSGMVTFGLIGVAWAYRRYRKARTVQQG